MPTSIVETFYEAFRRKDYVSMQNCYHPQARFTDEIFIDLDAAHVKAMWQMLLVAAKDMELVYKDVKVEGSRGSANWIATYTFSLTKRKVVNDIQAVMELRDGLIYRHRDAFDFYRWSKMAFGGKGVLLGRFPFFKRKIRKISMGRLEAFMAKNGL